MLEARTPHVPTIMQWLSDFEGVGLPGGFSFHTHNMVRVVRPGAPRMSFYGG